MSSPETLEIPQKGRIPSLDGCRALSICLVLISHLCNTPAFQALNPYTRTVYLFGPFGVKVFFVISGFLITTLLLNEEHKNGSISIKMFYLRRAFRIWPVAYAFILVVALFQWRGWITLPPHNLVYAGTFTMNHATGGKSWFTGHLWSLAIEEQFYLVWPVVIVFTAKRGRVLACCIMLLLAPLSRILTFVYRPEVYAVMKQSLLFMGDSIAVGCLLALFSGELENSSIVRRIIGSRWFFLVPVLSAVMYGTLRPFPAFNLGAGESIALVCIAATIWRAIRVQDAAFRLLNSKPLVTVGVFSYSIYIWQQLFLNPTSASIFNRLPINFLLICGAAMCSYYLIERPCLRLRPIFLEWCQSRGRYGGNASVASAVSPGNHAA